MAKRKHKPIVKEMKDTVAIAITKLSKRYGNAPKLALSNLSLEVHRGEVYGFLGANGAGKSTTIRTLLNFIQPSKGSATIVGHDSVRDAVAIKKHIGYLAGEVALYQQMTGKQFLSFMEQLQPLKHAAYRTDLVRRFRAELTKPIGTLSKGNRQKLGIIQAFMHEPEVLILDEPTSGLDPLMQEEFFAIVREAQERGASVFVSSHNFAEVQRMCSRVGFIREGKLVAERSLAELADQAAHTFTLTFAREVPLAELKKLPRSKVTPLGAHHATITTRGQLSPLFAILAKHTVTRMQQQEINLEQEFLRFYEKGGAK